jgi:hypothetical protein
MSILLLRLMSRLPVRLLTPERRPFLALALVRPPRSPLKLRFLELIVDRLIPLAASSRPRPVLRARRTVLGTLMALALWVTPKAGRRLARITLLSVLRLRTVFVLRSLFMLVLQLRLEACPRRVAPREGGLTTGSGARTLGSCDETRETGLSSGVAIERVGLSRAAAKTYVCFVYLFCVCVW